MYIEEFKKYYEKRHEYAKDFKKKHPDWKIVGTFCTYYPEELMYAAKVLPVRILGSHEPQNVTEPHIFGMFCPFCRDVLAQGLQGRYDYLDGIMIAQSCLHVRQSYTSWDLHIPVDFRYYLPMPHHLQSARAKDFLKAELEKFKKALEDWTGNKITDEALDEAIEILNENRRLLRQAYDFRKKDNPPMTGLEAMYMVVSSQMMHKKDHNEILKNLIEKELPNRDLGIGDHIRLMVLGSENDDVEFLDMVETITSNPAKFVIDDHCTGSRYFWNQVEPKADRLMAIAERYINRPPCPTKDWPNRLRLEHDLNLAKEWNVQGAVLLQQKFCDPHECDIPIFQRAFEEQGIKTLFLELDVLVPVGQFKIRTEAFLETLSSEDLF